MIDINATNYGYYNKTILEQNSFIFDKQQVLKLEIGAYGKLIANLLQLKKNPEFFNCTENLDFQNYKLLQNELNEQHEK